MSGDRETIVEMLNRSEKIFTRLDLLEKLGIVNNFLHHEVFTYLLYFFCLFQDFVVA